MSSVKPLDPPQDISQEIAFPPGDLFSDEPPLESELHLRQILLLLQSLEWFWNARQDFYACGNLTIYYSPNQRKSEQFRGPDFFVVLGVERKPRKSWVVWQEDGKYPNLIIEILSSSTAKTDRGLKKQIYQDIFRTPDYFWFDPDSLEFQGFHLVDGEYQDLQPNANGQLWSQQLQLYLGVHNSKLRWFDRENQLLLMPEEVARQEQQQREQAEQKALVEQQQREQTEQQLAETKTLLARYRERFGELPEQ
ncbi:Uma2 family endonuclease [Lusitaniella coriacea LEGE 07157]|uniref:Uma2 family endonuclease n=1 Tax=Lusitaniella coriacea LEGE 07157 TaxID=945747 RepID=A0A8J7E216_9CYAN|nr:Uma2 family endonuclease [Lusitaniella coriacea]MBE9118181.1 Uma2 family endonuclease [Lusitaniella coriacea LEGE 07157]